MSNSIEEEIRELNIKIKLLTNKVSKYELAKIKYPGAFVSNGKLFYELLQDDTYIGHLNIVHQNGYHIVESMLYIHDYNIDIDIYSTEYGITKLFDTVEKNNRTEIIIANYEEEFSDASSLYTYNVQRDKRTLPEQVHKIIEKYIIDYILSHDIYLSNQSFKYEKFQSLLNLS